MIYSFMRLILFFDLPMVTKSEKRVYNQFRKYLIKNGYIRMQFSVYCKLFGNRDAAVKHINVLKQNLPLDGQIRTMLVTEKQYSRIAILVGGISNQETTVNSEPFLKL